MKNYSDIEIKSLIKRFEDHTLPKDEWTHEAHLVVAVWYLLNNDFEDAMNRVRQYIIQLNDAVGTPNTDHSGYHETITKFWLITALDFLNEKKYNSVCDACNALINSEKGSSHYPMNFYSRDLLHSMESRFGWVEPDLIHNEKQS